MSDQANRKDRGNAPAGPRCDPFGVRIGAEDTMPVLGYGTWMLQGDSCVEGVTDALELGYRHVDTAQAYGNEAEVGQAIEGSGIGRDELFLVTKVWNDRHQRQDCLASIDESLSKLRTDYVDLVHIHWPVEKDAPIEETVEAIAEAQRQGKARHIGVSNFPPSMLERALKVAPLQCLQIEYHPLLSQDALLSTCRDHDMVVTAYSPLARGDDDLLDSDDVTRIAERYGKTPAQIVLRWLVQQPRVTTIPKAASGDHRRENCNIFDFELTASEMDLIRSLNEDERLIDPDFAPTWERAA